ncbi:MAG: cytochrome P450 [Spirosomataceae bacterium]
MRNTIPAYRPDFFPLKTPLTFARDPLAFIQKGFAACGDTFELNLFRKLVFTRDPAFYKQVLVQNHRNYVKGKALEELKKVLGNGLLTSEGDFWLRQRRLMQPVFHRERLQGLVRTMGDITADFLEELEAFRGKKAVDIDEKMMGLTADIALKTLFSTITNEDKAKIYQQINRSQEHIITHIRKPFLKPWLAINGADRRFRKDLDYFDGMIVAIVEQRRASGESSDDLLQMLLDCTDEETGGQMDDAQIRDELITMFAAGHDTSANGLNWLLAALSEHPDIVEKIRAESEIFEVVPTFEQLTQLTYTRQVVEEGLRLFPPAWAVAREALEDDEIEGKLIKKGTIVFMPLFELHRHPGLWKNPLVFDPEHFSPEQVKDRPKFSYLPFGAGPRICIGQQFALMEMQLVLASLVKRFTFVADPAHEPKMFPLITLKPLNGIRMFIK